MSTLKDLISENRPKEEIRKMKSEKGIQGRHGYTNLSYDCKKNWHGSCAALKCQCECHARETSINKL